MSIENLECPNCDHLFEYLFAIEGEEDGDYKFVECPSCKKNFGTVVQFSVNLVSEFAAPCQNGEPHNFLDIKTFPDIWKKYSKCEWCDEWNEEIDLEKKEKYETYIQQKIREMTGVK